MPEEAVPLTFKGDTTAVERWSLIPPRYWRFSWRWYVLSVQDATLTPDMLVYYQSNGRCQRFRSEVRTNYLAVRVGRHDTTFAAFDVRTKEAVPLQHAKGPYTWKQAVSLSEERLAQMAHVPYLPNITLM